MHLTRCLPCTAPALKQPPRCQAQRAVRVVRLAAYLGQSGQAQAGALTGAAQASAGGITGAAGAGAQGVYGAGQAGAGGILGAAQARTSGYLGSQNALASGFGGAYNIYQQQQLLNALTRNPGNLMLTSGGTALV
jgi:hypothetical protein